jgi:ribonuclease HI
LGASISQLEQRDFYKIINEKEKIPIRSRTNCNLEDIKICSQDTFNVTPTTGKIWLATKHKDFSRRVRDFMWKATQSAYKIGEFWLPIASYEERATCPLCDKIEDMEHILVKWSSANRSDAWQAANSIWTKRHPTPLLNRLGDILGCGLANFQRNGKPDKGKNRLYRILVSETAYLIWKMRNERRIRDNDGAPATTPTTIKRWSNTINKRLTIDRFLTDSKRFGKRALNEKLVKATWTYCLKDEDTLPSNWPYIKGVLVGIALRCPQDTDDEALSSS